MKPQIRIVKVNKLDLYFKMSITSGLVPILLLLDEIIDQCVRENKKGGLRRYKKLKVDFKKLVIKKGFNLN